MMKQYIEKLVMEAFGHYVSKPLDARETRQQKRQRIRALWTLLQLLTIITFILLYAVTATAQESDPKFKFQQPSDEMDFTLPPLAELPEGLPKANANDNTLPPPDLYDFETPLTPEQIKEKKATKDDAFVDQFFSTTTVISPDDMIKEEPTITENISKKKSKKVTKKRREPEETYPSHEFKSVRLPTPIYHKNYSKDNKYLPFAYMEKDQQNLLTQAVIKDDIITMGSLYRNAAHIDWSDENGTTLLVLAAQHQSVNAARWLLQHKVNPNDTDGAGLAPLHYAAYAGNHQIVTLLLAYGADKNMADIRGQTPLMYAELRPISNVVQKLLAF